MFALCRACRRAFQSYENYEFHCKAKGHGVEAAEAVMAEEIPEGFQVTVDGRPYPRNQAMAKLAERPPAPPLAEPPKTAAPEAVSEETPPTNSPHEEPEAPTDERKEDEAPPAGRGDGEWPLPQDAWRTVDPAERLRALVQAVGAPPANVESIVNSFRQFPELRTNPYALDHCLRAQFPARIHTQVDMVVRAMVPHLERSETPSGQPQQYPPQYAPQYPAATASPYAPYYPPQYGQYPPGQYPPTGGYYPYPPQGWQPGASNPALPPSPHDSPAVKALQDQVTALTKTLEKAEEARREEKHEAELKTREDQYRQHVQGLGSQVEDLKKLILEKEKAEAGEQATLRESVLGAEVRRLGERLEHMQAASTNAAIERLEQRLAQAQSDFQNARTGRTTEDLVADALPLVKGTIENAGEGLSRELAGLRSVLVPGSITVNPPQIPPIPAQAPGTTRAEEARRVAEMKAAEDAMVPPGQGD